MELLHDLESHETNVSSPISQIPHEIFLKILTDLLWSSYPPDSLTITPVTQVAKRWREVSISCPSLWSCLVLDRNNGSNAAAQISRSKDSPLYLHLRSVSQSIINLISQNRHHVRSIFFSGSHDSAETLLNLLSTKQLPILTELTLLAFGMRSERSGADDQPRNDLVPSLRSLAIGPSNVNWDWAGFRNLTKLRILRPDLDPLLSALHIMPQLQSINIQRIAQRTINQPGPIVDLPALLDLEIAEDWDVTTFPDLLKFLNRLHIPPEAHVKLHRRTMGQKHVDPFPFHPLHRSTRSRNLGITCTDGHIYFSNPGSKPSIDVELLWYTPCTPTVYDVTSLINWLLGKENPGCHSNANLKFGKELHFFQQDEWVDVGRSLTHLKTLKLDYDASTQRFLKALTGSAEVLIPGLQRLIVECKAGDGGEDTQGRFDALFAFLALRRESNHAIQDVQIWVDDLVYDLYVCELQQLRCLGVDIIDVRQAS